MKAFFCSNGFERCLVTLVDQSLDDAIQRFYVGIDGFCLKVVKDFGYSETCSESETRDAQVC